MGQPPALINGARLSQMPLDLIEKVNLAKQHNVEHWPTPALKELPQR